jgi:predicted branched-subunit amino acid permease
VRRADRSGPGEGSEYRAALTAVGTTVVLFGVSYGVLAAEAGLDLAQTLATSTVIMAGAVQFSAVGALAAGATPLAALVAGAVVTARYIPLGLLAGTVLRPARGPRGLLDLHVMTDQSVMLGRTGAGTAQRARRYREAGAVMIVTWLIGTALGRLAADLALPVDPATIGLDAAYPALFMTLLAPDLRADRRTVLVALLGVAIAVPTVALAPVGAAPAAATLAALVVLVLPGGASGPDARSTDPSVR